MAVKEIEIPQHIRDEIDYFATEVKRFKKKQVDEETFKGFRLHHGIYGQRQDGVQMVRIKIPYGAMNPDQLERCAEIAETITDGNLHMTTRQDIQLHWVQLDDVVEMMNSLAAVGLTTREACGNSVRNVTATPYAGVHPREAFDVSPYVHAVAYHLMRNELTSHLPRKFKVAFSGSLEDDGGIVAIHDIGGVARIRDGKKGFELYAGGGLGATPVMAEKVDDFVPVGFLLPACEALVLIHHHHSNRKNRMQARMKFVLKDWGVEKFKARYEELFAERKALWLEEHGENWDADLSLETRLPEEAPYELKTNGDAHFNEWLETAVLPQKQTGYSMIKVRLQHGDLHASTAKKLADICREFLKSDIRITQDQDLLLRGVRTKDLPAIYERLKEIGLNTTGAFRLRNVIACPGTDTCNLGITSSHGLEQAIGRALDEMPEHRNLDGMTIKISGCPNSCGQHHIGSLGFYGNAKKVHGRLVPHFDVLVGGGWAAGKAEVGQSVIKLPSKRIPEAVKWIVRTYASERSEGQDFNSWAAQYDKKWWKEKLTPFAGIGTFAQDREKYVDYLQVEPFSLNDRGIGECAGAIVDMVTELFNEADHFTFKAQEQLKAKNWKEASISADNAVYWAGKALLYTIGIDDKRRFEIGHKFIYNVIDKAVMEDTFQHLPERLINDAAPYESEDEATRHVGEVLSFVGECRNIQRRANDGESTLGTEPRAGGGENLPERDRYGRPFDLRGAKRYDELVAKLGGLKAGDYLEVWLDQGEPEKTVPEQVRQAGHKVIEQNTVNDFYRVVVQKA